MDREVQEENDKIAVQFQRLEKRVKDLEEKTEQLEGRLSEK